jgi:SAM-dependent methyltransferase
MKAAVFQTKPNQSVAIKRAHEHYLDRWLGLYEYDEYREWLFSGLLKILKEYVTHGSVLEIGCSKGYLSNLLNKNGFSSIGGDISKTALRLTKNIKTVRIDGENLPFKNCCFDVVLAISTIEHMPKPANCIQETSRVLKKNGLFIAITPDKNSYLGKIGYHLVNYTSLKNPYHVGLINKKELTSMLNEAGFKKLLLQPFHNGFFGAPLLEKVFHKKVIPIPLKVPIPFSHHFIAIAYKNQSAQESNCSSYVEAPEIAS